MSSYRLLRSNKESGPFTQEELIAMGFKPYDLIWVEGKSAGWRYPSEISELKAYAPVVEEQPYDRFFKKPVVPARGTPLPQNIIEPVYRQETVAMPMAGPAPIAAAAAPVPVEASRPAFSPSTASVGRHIHVTLPSGNTLNVTTLSGRATPAAAPASEKSVQPAPEEKPASFSATLAAQPLFAPVAETVPTRKTAVAAIKEKEAIADTTPYYPQQRAAGFSWTMMIGMVVGIATLVGLGIMIGLSINRGKAQLAGAGLKENNIVLSKQEARPVSSAAEQGPPDNADNHTNILPVVNTSNGSASHPNAGAPVNNAVVNPPAAPQPRQQQALVVKDAGGNRTKTAGATKKDVKTAENKPVEKAASEPAARDKDPIVVHPKASEAIPVVNLGKQVNIHTNGYKVGAFGGISDLQCTLVNDSRYALESVEVELQYVQANDKVFKTETISFRDVAAGAQVTMNAPKSPRGVKITSRIVKINAREPGLASITIKS